MTTELLEKMQDAGYPFKRLLTREFFTVTIRDKAYVQPTLEDLFAACGDCAVGYNIDKECHATKILFDENMFMKGAKEGRGETVREALSKLFIELNQNHETLR